jgi:N-acyl-phosphatidylethanolamine-hydrolysing phospholipase D
VKWMLTRSRSVRPSVPGENVAPRISETVSLPPRSKRLTATWLGHSSFLVQCEGLNILTDPIWSDRASPVAFAGPRRLVPPPLPLQELPAVDFTLISHDHYDHLDDATVRALASRFPRMKWVVPLGVGKFLRKRGAAFVTEMDWWEEREIAGVRIGCTPAQHFSGRYPWNRDSTLWCGWTIAFPHARVFFAGDTALHPDFGRISSRFGPFDMAILPIGAYEPRWFMRTVHMTPEDSVAAFREIAAGETSGPDSRCVMLASHWGTFRLTDEPIMEPPRLARHTWMDAALPPDLLWILAPGETRSIDR